MTQNPHQAEWARGIWERAVEAEKGLRLDFKTKKAATSARFALYTARTINREENTEIFAPGDPEYGRSPWDEFKATIEQDESGFHLLITRHSNAAPMKVSEL